MAKIVKDTELVELIRSVVESKEIQESPSYRGFLYDITNALCSHFGGRQGHISYDPDLGLGWTVAVHQDASVPPDGGIWNRVDTDVSWHDGKED